MLANRVRYTLVKKEEDVGSYLDFGPTCYLQDSGDDIAYETSGAKHSIRNLNFIAYRIYHFEVINELDLPMYIFLFTNGIAGGSAIMIWQSPDTSYTFNPYSRLRGNETITKTIDFAMNASNLKTYKGTINVRDGSADGPIVAQWKFDSSKAIPRP